MILLVNAANRGAFPELLEDLFRARHEVFVDGLGWEELRRPDGRELDAWDRDDSVYLVALGDDGVTAGARLTGAEGPTLAATLLPELFEEDPPAGGDILEVSRLFERWGEGSALDLLEACAEFGRLVGARGLLTIADLALIQAMLARGAPVEPLGLPRRTRAGTLMAALLRPSPMAGRLEPLLAWADGPGAPIRPLAEILRVDPRDRDWKPPGALTATQRSALSPHELAEAYWSRGAL